MKRKRFLVEQIVAIVKQPETGSLQHRLIETRRSA